MKNLSDKISGYFEVYRQSGNIYYRGKDNQPSNAAYNFLKTHLNKRGFNLRPDKSVNHRIRKGYKIGHRNLLQLSMEVSGYRISMNFYQDLNIINTNGGKYDYNKFDLMPFTVKREFLLTLYKLKVACKNHGIRYFVNDDITEIQRQIDSDNINTHIHGRITCLEDIEKGLSSSDLAYNCWDNNKKLIKYGEVKCFYRGMQLYQGVFYHAINNMWFTIIANQRYQIASYELFDPYPGMPRRRTDKKVKRLTQELELSISNKNYKRVSILAKVLDSLTPTTD